MMLSAFSAERHGFLFVMITDESGALV